MPTGQQWKIVAWPHLFVPCPFWWPHPDFNTEEVIKIVTVTVSTVISWDFKKVNQKLHFSSKNGGVHSLNIVCLPALPVITSEMFWGVHFLFELIQSSMEIQWILLFKTLPKSSSPPLPPFKLKIHYKALHCCVNNPMLPVWKWTPCYHKLRKSLDDKFKCLTSKWTGYHLGSTNITRKENKLRELS